MPTAVAFIVPLPQVEHEEVEVANVKVKVSPVTTPLTKSETVAEDTVPFEATLEKPVVAMVCSAPV